MRLTSLKTRIMFGAIFWTIGLLTIIGIFLTLWHQSGHLTVSNRSTPTGHPDPNAAMHVVHSLFQPSIAMAVVEVLSMYFGCLLVHRGMAPLNELRDRLAAVRTGVDGRVFGTYPEEVQPLIDELNGLLEEREVRVTRALAKAGDLAHGLKTPLTVLAYEAQQARAAGQEQLAVEIDQQIDRMRRQIDYHLAHAQSAVFSASPGSQGIGSRICRRTCARTAARARRAQSSHRDRCARVARIPGTERRSRRDARKFARQCV